MEKETRPGMAQELGDEELDHVAGGNGTAPLCRCVRCGSGKDLVQGVSGNYYCSDCRPFAKEPLRMAPLL